MIYFIFIIGVILGGLIVFIERVFKHKSKLMFYKNELRQLEENNSKNSDGKYASHIYFEMIKLKSIIREYDKQII